jgi:biopolymer transport protein ExbB
MVAYGQGGEKAGRLVVLGADEQASTWMSGTFGILMRSLTVDGWVVIGVLAVMAVISWWVMVIKTSYLNANAKGNALFMSEWRHLAADLTALDHGDPDKVRSVGGRVDSDAEKLLRHASVYRIYHIGAEEIRHRVAGDAAPDTRVLSARSIQAIRASMDAGMVRETQKLNQLMVFLTIAISGGPFLGLLGTVVGVMITFAAIAAAGDVNVNAIAPGIAAALVATVAGLVVAIPALFGYNYLTSRVKEASNDMHVFVDEFVTKMAEFYGDENMVDIGGH